MYPGSIKKSILDDVPLVAAVPDIRVPIAWFKPSSDMRTLTSNDNSYASSACLLLHEENRIVFPRYSKCIFLRCRQLLRGHTYHLPGLIIHILLNVLIPTPQRNFKSAMCLKHMSAQHAYLAGTRTRISSETLRPRVSTNIARRVKTCSMIAQRRKNSDAWPTQTPTKLWWNPK
jgi:hypothetical protein